MVKKELIMNCDFQFFNLSIVNCQLSIVNSLIHPPPIILIPELSQELHGAVQSPDGDRRVVNPVEHRRLHRRVVNHSLKHHLGPHLQLVRGAPDPQMTPEQTTMLAQ